MTEPSDPFWDELGVSWSAINPNTSVITARLQARLRRQSAWMSAVVVIGLFAGAMGGLLGIGTIGIGFSSGALNFVTRGVAITCMSALLLFAVRSLLPIGSQDATRALSEMIDLAINRAQKTLSLISACLYSCAIAAVFGLVGTAIRTHLGRPPKMSPIVDVAVVALIALALFLYRRQFRLDLAKYTTLKRALAAHKEA